MWCVMRDVTYKKEVFQLFIKWKVTLNIVKIEEKVLLDSNNYIIKAFLDSFSLLALIKECVWQKKISELKLAPWHANIIYPWHQII